jgi:hypothetical protein
MSIQLKTHKMLWGRSGNICAFPDCKKELVTDISETDDPSIVGEEAHIIAKEPDGPRGASPLTIDQRDRYENLILMCSEHHKIIDDHPRKFTIEILHQYKRNHEEWIKKSLKIDSKQQREDEVYATYIDEFVRLADIEHWTAWTSHLFGGDLPKIWVDQYNNLRALIQYILSRVWFNRYPSLENALYNFKSVCNDLLNVLDKHSETTENNEIMYTKKFYHIDEWNPELYERLSEKYMYHVKLIEDLAMELTRASNYIFDKIRESLFSSFRIKEGVLLIERGPFMDLSWKTHRLEYRDNQRVEFPYPGLRKFMEIRSSDRDWNCGEGISEDYFLHD